MVYLRAKTVKGEKYLYLVRSVWDPKRNTSRQEIIKYLGKTSNVTKDDIPLAYRNDPKVLLFFASDIMVDTEKNEELLSKLHDQLFRFFVNGDLDKAKKLYESYRAKSGTASFFEKILTPVMYRVGDLWAAKKISIADEHVCSNVASNLVKTIFDRNVTTSRKKKVLICTPDGEYHNLGANILESHLSCNGFKVYNLSPSEPHEAIISFIDSTKPDAVFVSITLVDNLRPGQRLVRKIKERFDVPVFVGGQALKDDHVKFEAQVVHETDLKKISKLLN